jgi:hypothetical protein
VLVLVARAVELAAGGDLQALGGLAAARQASASVIA